MPAQTDQLPRIDLPGAEYFTLAPNRTIILENRLTQITSSNVFSVPASGQIGAQLAIVADPNWTYGHGVYLVRGTLLAFPQDTTGELQITTARFGIGTPPTNYFNDLGIPTSTQTTPAGPQVAIFDRDSLITFIDTGQNFVPNTPISWLGNLTFKNLDATNPHSAQITLQCIWHRCNGFVQ